MRFQPLAEPAISTASATPALDGLKVWPGRRRVRQSMGANRSLVDELFAPNTVKHLGVSRDCTGSTFKGCAQYHKLTPNRAKRKKTDLGLNLVIWRVVVP
jgi:hypothetical protein